MYGELYQYLVLRRQLHLPGIGTFSVERKPASLDFTDKLAYPPAFTIVLQPGTTTPSRNFFHWLGASLGVSDRDAVIRFNDFLFELKKQLSAGHTLQWPGVGAISKGSAGDAQLEAQHKDWSPESPVPAVMVLRQNAEHTLLVGEQEKSSADMQALVAEEELVTAKKTRWWIAALTVGILSAAFVTYYFATHGFRPSSAASHQKLVPAR